MTDNRTNAGVSVDKRRRSATTARGSISSAHASSGTRRHGNDRCDSLLVRSVVGPTETFRVPPSMSKRTIVYTQGHYRQ